MRALRFAKMTPGFCTCARLMRVAACLMYDAAVVDWQSVKCYSKMYQLLPIRNREKGRTKWQKTKENTTLQHLSTTQAPIFTLGIHTVQ